MKKFAYYLPQFHRIPENDAWWGEGFTEWVNVRKARPLFKGHQQPVEPLNDNYYSLLDPDTLRWQAELAREYRVDGFIFYHYYFKGKKLLEKPAELLLQNAEIPMHFFFCWANHDWNRAWEGKREILLKQEYGTEDDWEAHFQYLLPFFRDKRYEKKENKPLFMIFRTAFPEKERIMSYFNKRCIEEGFDGICVIETALSYRRSKLRMTEEQCSSVTSYIQLREPAGAMDWHLHTPLGLIHAAWILMERFLNNHQKRPYLEKYNGNSLYHLMLTKTPRDHRYISCLFFEWDNTPRHGKRGYLISPPDKNRFMRQMDEAANDEYVFLNAWNEWAEGMMLEPTKQKGYCYLEWIREWTVQNGR